MPIVLFIIDNSASMGQRCYLGTRLLDVAKGAVETFIKMRSREHARNDRYMLVTFDEHPHCIKAAWKDNLQTLSSRLKSLTPEGLTSMGHALRTSFDLLNMNRLISSIDTYGQGRSPFFLEPAMIIAITDGGKLSNKNGIQDQLHLPMASPLPGSELTKEPFRWDQRLFSLVLRLPATTTNEPEQLGSVPSDSSPISLMCEVTGGRSYTVTSQKTLMQCLDSLVQKAQSGVVLHFEKIDMEPKELKFVLEGNSNGSSSGKLSVNHNDPPGSRSASPAMTDHSLVGQNVSGWTSLHRMVYVRPSSKSGIPAGHWPLPEAYWPDPNAPSLPPRTAHPILRFACVDTEPLLVPNFPYDKYELEPSPLTQVLLEKKNPNICWQVFVENSSKYGKVRYPCGYLKASSNLACVNLFVMPYNYTCLLPLIQQLINLKMKPHHQWKREFDEYIQTIPSYYLNPCRKALRQLGAPNLISENIEYSLSYSVVMNFKTLKQKSKSAAEALLATVGLPNPHVNKPIPISSKFKSQNTEFGGFLLNMQTNGTVITSRSFHNAFDVPRSQLLTQLKKMKINLKRAISASKYTRIRLQDRAELHNQPISQMGNYQEYAKTLPQPLREIDADAPKRLHTFGNPFKIAKEKGMFVDETEDYEYPSTGVNKRKMDRNRRGKSKRTRYNSFSTTPSSPKVVPPSQPHSAPSSPLPLQQTSSPVWELTNGHLEAEDAVPSKKRKLNVEENDNETNEVDREVENINKIQIETTNCNGRKPLPDTPETHPPQKPIAMKQPTVTSPPSLTEKKCIARNNVIKDKVIRLIRIPGKHYNKIFEEVNGLNGPHAHCIHIIQILITEAKRFKRDNLVQLFHQYQTHIKKRHRISSH